MADLPSNIPLLNKLNVDQVNQIIVDYETKDSLEFIYFIDSYDILSYIDPYSLMFESSSYESKEKNVLADEYYALKTLLDNSKNDVFLLEDYSMELADKESEFNFHTRSIAANVLDSLNTKNDKENEEIIKYIKENFSKILFYLSGSAKSVYAFYKEIFDNNKIGVDYKLEEKCFATHGVFSQEEKKKIDLIYKETDRSFSDYVDAVAICKVFIMNEFNVKGKKHIYLSSAKKSRSLMLRIKERLTEDKKLNKNKRQWEWLQDILDNYPEENLLFFRNKAYTFGYILFKSFINRSKSSDFDKEVAIEMFKRTCNTDDFKENNINGLLKLFHEKRESYENLAVLIDYQKSKKLKNSFDEIQRDGRISNKIIDFIRSLKYDTVGDLFVEMDTNIIIDDFNFKLIQYLIDFCSSDKNQLQFDRGNDNIVSLFNSLPPLFVFDENSIFKEKVTQLILSASKHSTEASRLERDRLVILLNELLKKMDYSESYFNSLLLIFILIFVRKKNDNLGQSNQQAYDYCIELESKFKIEMSKNSNYSNKKIRYEELLKELYVLKIWAERRIGNDYSNERINRITQTHIALIAKYKDDYRYSYSYFLSKINFIYHFIELNSSNVTVIFKYVDEIIRIGKVTKKLLKKSILKNTYENDEYLKNIYTTLINSYCFILCVKLDLLFYQESLNTKEKRSYKLQATIDSLITSIGKLKTEIKARTKSRDPNNPVYHYVEAYIEYMQAMTYKEKRSKQLFYAIRTLEEIPLNENIERIFFKQCYDLLLKTLKEAKDEPDLQYQSFIMQLKIS
nr:hypothetical protein [uncultured Psychroserpens sp.]